MLMHQVLDWFTVRLFCGKNSLIVNGDIVVDGSLSANAKYFTIKHPDPEKGDQYLAHSCIESDRHSVMYAHRISASGSWTSDPNSGKYVYRLELPSYFRHLVRQNSVIATLTPLVSQPAWYYVCEQNHDEWNQNIIRIECSNPHPFNVLIMATRSDMEDFIVEFDEGSKANVRRRKGQPDMPDNRQKSSITKKAQKKENPTKDNVKPDAGVPKADPPPPPQPQPSNTSFDTFLND